MPVIYEVVAHGEKYTTQDGQEKSRLINIGKVIEKQNGKMSIKLDAVPVAWDGWAMLLPPREKEASAPAPAARRQAVRTPGEDDDVAF